MSRNSYIIIALYITLMVVCVGLLLPDTVAWVIAALGVIGLVQLYGYLSKQAP